MYWIAQLVGIALISAVLSAWARGARTDRLLRLLLLALLWTIALGLVVAGLGIMVAGARLPLVLARGAGYTLTMTGVAMLLALVAPVRRLLARFLPFDAESVPDQVGLAVLLALIAGNLAGLIWLAGDLRVAPVSVVQLVGQSVTLVAVAALAVGLGIERTWGSTVRRLGFTRLTWVQAATALGFTVALFVIAGAAGALTQWLQPELAREIEDRLVQMTQDVSSVSGALAVSIAAGVGEETLFRGAIQPRYGILLTSALFTLVHVQYGLSIITAGVFAISLLLGLERRYLGTTACILTHATYNAVAILLQNLAP
uniref:CPBP family intramembrane metalloprotease n=1 Tax=Thermorudis peleae TaxID=1382356 RepID=A0A831TCE8_9BACT